MSHLHINHSAIGTALLYSAAEQNIESKIADMISLTERVIMLPERIVILGNSGSGK